MIKSHVNSLKKHRCSNTPDTGWCTARPISSARPRSPPAARARPLAAHTQPLLQDSCIKTAAETNNNTITCHHRFSQQKKERVKVDTDPGSKLTPSIYKVSRLISLNTLHLHTENSCLTIHSTSLQHVAPAIITKW